MNGWDALYCAASVGYAPVMLWRRARTGKYRESLPAMLGRRLPAHPLERHDPRFWIHSVSVGETVAAGAVAKALVHRFPSARIVSTTTTETGQALARKSLPMAEVHTYAPLDFSWRVRAHLDAYRPTAYVLMETEWWPNTLAECARRGLPVFVANGKLSERSARGYARLRRLLEGPLSAVRLFLMQNEDYAERLERVLGPTVRRRLIVTGNVKFDALPAPLGEDARRSLRAEWGIAPDSPVILAGSTHPGEEDLVASAWKTAAARVPGLRLVIAPRHPERFAAVVESLRKAYGSAHALSTGAPPPGTEPILVLDKMGVLASSFGAADVALVGGAWNPIGGHNLLEPAAHGIPVLYGPHMHNQPEIVRILAAEDAAGETPRNALADRLIELFTTPEERLALGARARRAAEAQRGAAARTVEAMAKAMGG